MNFLTVMRNRLGLSQFSQFNSDSDPDTEFTDYRKHLPQNIEPQRDGTSKKRDFAQKISPLMGACPHMPKTK